MFLVEFYEKLIDLFISFTYFIYLFFFLFPLFVRVQLRLYDMVYTFCIYVKLFFAFKLSQERSEGVLKLHLSCLECMFL